MDWGKIGAAALQFIPAGGPVLKGISVLASIIGGDAGDKINSGLAQIEEGLKEVGKTPLSPDQQIELEKSKQATQIKLKKLAYEDKKLAYDDQAGGREVVKTALMSNDEFVRQARPRMMVNLGKAAIAYTFLTPFMVLLCAWLNVEKDLTELLVKLVLWQGGTLWTTFTASFTGYTVARSADKRAAAMQDIGVEPGKLLKALSKAGHKIS